MLAAGLTLRAGFDETVVDFETVFREGDLPAVVVVALFAVAAAADDDDDDEEGCCFLPSPPYLFARFRSSARFFAAATASLRDNFG